MNADVFRGPVAATTNPVDPDKFLTLCKTLKEITISIGWTTEWGNTSTFGAYFPPHIDAMIAVLNKYELIESQYKLTFPVRAGIAAQSHSALSDLFSRINRTTPDVTLTIWSAPNDYVNVTALRELIVSIGVHRVYIDLPKDLHDKLNLPGSGSTLAHFGLMNLMAFGLFVALKTKLLFAIEW